VATRWESLAAFQRAQLIQKLRGCFQEGKPLSGMMAAVYMADPSKAEDRALLLGEIDARSARNKGISADDDAARWALYAECVAELGFDPRQVDAPRQADNVIPFPMKPARLELSEGISGPLMSGDWAGLWERVQAGQLTEEEAKQIGQIWTNHGR
jgi:hypothetical protein